MAANSYEALMFWQCVRTSCTCDLSRFNCVHSLRPYGLSFARFLCSWDSLGKNTRVGSHALLQGIFMTQGLNLRFFTTSTTWEAQGLYGFGGLFSFSVVMAYRVDHTFLSLFSCIHILQERYFGRICFLFLTYHSTIY